MRGTKPREEAGEGHKRRPNKAAQGDTSLHKASFFFGSLIWRWFYKRD
jgi:hypothetical protein